MNATPHIIAFPHGFTPSALQHALDLARPTPDPSIAQRQHQAIVAAIEAADQLGALAWSGLADLCRVMARDAREGRKLLANREQVDAATAFVAGVER